MPATFAANALVFSKVAGEMEIGSMLDIGAGPGTSMWAASEFFPSVQRFTLIERDRELAELGRSLAGYSSNEAVRGARWEHRDITDPIEFEPHDLVLLSYVIGELSSAAAERVLRAAWLKTAKMLIVIEPGTPRNFARLAVARSLLIDVGGYPAAPCPHAAQCPMAAAGDWCHFSERLQRTAEHRRAKGGALGYEDEKFSYFAVGKTAVEHAQARIVRHPMKHKGHVQMTLCTPDGIQRQTVSKSQKEAYREARDAEWGDAWGWRTEK